jgi:hypothetical protein
VSLPYTVEFPSIFSFFPSFPLSLFPSFPLSLSTTTWPTELEGVQAPLRLLLTALLCNMLTSMMPQLNEELRLLELPNAEGNREFQVRTSTGLSRFCCSLQGKWSSIISTRLQHNICPFLNRCSYHNPFYVEFHNFCTLCI